MQYKWYKSGPDLLDEINRAVFPSDSVGIWFLGQESLALKYQDKILWLDPFFTDLFYENGESMRCYAPPFEPGEISRADFAFGTHDHIDHIDIGTLQPIAKNNKDVLIVVPAPHVSKLKDAGIPEKNIAAAKAFEELQFSPEIKVLPIPAAHEIYETDENGNHKHLSYLLTLGDISVFHGGDFVWTERTLEDLKDRKIDVMCLPINGADYKRRSEGTIGNINAREAADLADAVNADLLIPLHYDLFAGNGENPAVFVDYMVRYHRDRKFHIMAHGECFVYKKENQR